jgi:hypothetical protein
MSSWCLIERAPDQELNEPKTINVGRDDALLL